MSLVSKRYISYNQRAMGSQQNQTDEFKHNRSDLMTILFATLVIGLLFSSIQFFSEKYSFLAKISENTITKFIK